MRKGAVAALLVIGILAGTGAGYYIWSSTEKTQTAPTTTITCLLSVHAPLFLILKNDSGAPIPNQPLSIQAHLLEQFVVYSTAGGCHPIYSTHIWSNETGSDGKILLGYSDDMFNVTTSYLGETYHVNAVAGGTLSAECVTWSLPSGAVNMTFSTPYGNYQC